MIAKLALILYQTVFPLVVFGVVLKLVFAGRGRTLREGFEELRQRLGLLSESELRPLEGGRVAWVHAASVGEVLAAQAFIRAAARLPEAPRFLVTTTTVAGRDKARTLEGVDQAVLAPMDFFPAVLVFLRRTDPACLLLVETELWPMTLWTAGMRRIPIGLVNARITERAFSRYRLAGGLFHEILRFVRRAAIQTEADARRYRGLGLPGDTIAVTGNVKYDQPLPPEREVQDALARTASLGFAKDMTWIAASTRRGEEEMILDAHLQARRDCAALRLILAPRHPERTKEVEALLRARGIRSTRWSQALPFESDPDCLLVDRMGILSRLYGAARVSFVGGTLVPVGGHNLLEPALASVPVLFGPYTDSVRSVAEALNRSGGGRKVQDAAALAKSLGELMPAEAAARAGRRARETAREFSGATEKALAHLKPLLLSD